MCLGNCKFQVIQTSISDPWYVKEKAKICQYCGKDVAQFHKHIADVNDVF